MKEEKVIFSDYPMPPSAKYMAGANKQFKNQANKEYFAECFLWARENESNLIDAHAFLDKNQQFRIKMYFSLHAPNIIDDEGNLIDNDPSEGVSLVMASLTESIRISKNRFTSTLVEKLQITYKVPEHVNIVISPHKMRVFQ